MTRLLHYNDRKTPLAKTFFGPYSVFRFRFLYAFMFVCIYIYLSQNGGAEVSLNLPSFYLLCLHLRSHLIK